MNSTAIPLLITVSIKVTVERWEVLGVNWSWSVSKRNGLKCRLGNKAVMLSR